VVSYDDDTAYGYFILLYFFQHLQQQRGIDALFLGGGGQPIGGRFFQAGI
jgi:hypothetical protein